MSGPSKKEKACPFRRAFSLEEPGLATGLLLLAPLVDVDVYSR